MAQIDTTQIPASAWIGLVDTRENAPTHTLAISATTTTNGYGGASTSLAAGMVATGHLEASSIGATIADRFLDGVIMHDLSKAAGTDSQGLAGVQALSDTYPEHQYLVLVDLEEAFYDSKKLSMKSGLISGIALGTVGLAYPFMLPWTLSDIKVPLRGEATFKVFNRETERFDVMETVTIEEDMMVSGVAYFAKGREKVGQEALRVVGMRLAEAGMEALGSHSFELAPQPVATLQEVEE